MSVTKQEYYDMLVCAALDGTFPSFDEESKQCLYKSADGKNSCALGILIPDSLYTSLIEKQGIYENGVYNWFINNNLLPLDMTQSEAADVQSIHDDIASSIWDLKYFLQHLNSLPVFRYCHRIVGEMQE